MAAQRIKVKFGTTEEQIKRILVQLCEKNQWDQKRVLYVIDIDSCTVTDTVYAVADASDQLPLHPDGPNAVHKLIS